MVTRRGACQALKLRQLCALVLGMARQPIARAACTLKVRAGEERSAVLLLVLPGALIPGATRYAVTAAGQQFSWYKDQGQDIVSQTAVVLSYPGIEIWTAMKLGIIYGEYKVQSLRELSAASSRCG